ncbi:hypothetical protein ACOMHN_047772 [Nucella lapillus]
MASSGVVPRSIYQNKPQTARMRNIPVIPHPMTKMGDASELMITGTASPDTRRPQTVAGYSVNLVNWSESDLVSTRKKRYVKKALVTGTRTDGELLEKVAERLVDGFQGMRQLFRAKDRSGKESVTREGLLRILYTSVGHVDNDAYDRMLLNLGLNKKARISFDLFVSRFSDIEDIRKQWMTPVKRAATADRQEMAHPEESLRDCEVHDWAQLKVAPHAAQILLKALRQGKVDLRSLLPDECFLPHGVVTKLQMRYALLDLGVNLTDIEYRQFWEKFDKNNSGFLAIQDLYYLLNLTPEGEPKKPRPASTRKPNNTNKKKQLPGSKTDRSSRPAAQAAREFSQQHHKNGDLKGGLGVSFRVEGIRPQSARLPDRRAATEEEETWYGRGCIEMPEAVARSKIRAVMRQKQYSKLDSILDCLHHKFEERHYSLINAFKLFDIHDDGHVMHIDFRRVLKEFGLPVTAIQLGLLVQRFGIIMKQGLIGYRQLLSKLFSHSEPLTSRALDDYMQTRLGGGMEDVGMGMNGESGGEEEEVIARRLVQYIHHEYLDLALFLLRSDRRNKGVLHAADMRAGVERCLGYKMTDRQWAGLQAKLPRDVDGAVRYLDFLMSFGNAAAGAWNLQSVGQVTVPRNKVTYPPTEEVRRLERARSEMVPTSLPRKEEHRPLHQLRKELEEFFAQHLHEVEQRFRELDRKSHKGFSQWQFGALLNLCEFPMTDMELTAFWVSQKLDADLSTFEDVVRQFLPSYNYPTTGWADKDAKSGHTSMWVAYTGSPTKKTTTTALPQTKRATTAHARASPSPFLTLIMRKARPAVQRNWEYLRQAFRSSDPNGLGTVTFQQMRRLVEVLRAGLSPEERNQLCEEFDFRKNGRCNYLAFMKAFSAENCPDSLDAYDPRARVLDRKPKDSAEPLTVSDALTLIRQKLLKQYKSLRRGFTTNDRSKCGYLSMEDFKRVLSECSVPVSDPDLYHLLSEFDADMDGRVSYPEFLDALLRMG